MVYKEVEFHDVSVAVREMMIAILAENGYEGFEEREHSLAAFIASPLFDEKLIADTAASFHIGYTLSQLEETNWNKAWESNFDPVVLDDFCVIRAAFHEERNDVPHEIIITPKMSFGTGHHATTMMMLRQMKEIGFQGKRVLDFGTGTGVLAILAAKMGAARVVAIDNDDWSIANARENFVNNSCSPVLLQQANTADAGETFDVILANIIRNVILENFPLFIAQLTPGGTLLLSGLLKEDETLIENEAALHHLRLQTKLESGNWVCLRYCR